MVDRFSSLSSTTRAIIFMILALFCLCSMDAAIKELADRHHIMQLVWVRYVGQSLLAVVLLDWKLRPVIQTRNPWIQLFRSVMVFTGAISFFIGFTNIDLAAATTILQVNPLIVAIGAWFFLGERFGWRRMAGVLAGLAGALIIIRPGTSMFTPYSLFPLVAALSFSFYAIATRFLSEREGIGTSFFFTTILGALFASIIVPFYWTTPQLTDIPLMILAAGFGTAGQYVMIRALFLADASVVSPFGYTALVFAAFYGFVFFGEVPDLWTCTGAVVIAGSGLYIWHRETRKRAG